MSDKMDSSDVDDDLERNIQSMFNAVLVEWEKGNEKSICSQVQIYVDEGVDINAVDNDGNTVLHIAVRKGYEKVVKFLLDSRARINIVNNEGDTAISLAEKLNDRKIARMLKDSAGSLDEQLPGTSQTQRSDNLLHGPGSVLSSFSGKRNMTSKSVEYVKKIKLSPVDINPRELLPGTLKTLRFDNSGYHSRSAPSISSRKRTADLELKGPAKEIRSTPVNETQRAAHPDSEETSRDENHQRNESEEEISRNSGGYTKETYGASGVKNSLHGVIYQLKHLMLTLNIAWKKGYRFRLATEIDSAEKFDDLVFEYEDSEGNRVHRFVQMKHKQDDTELINVRDFLADDDSDFSVKKYFTSMRKIKKHSDFSQSQSKYFIICTNIGIKVEELNNNQIEVIEVDGPDDFLNVAETAKQPRRYKLGPPAKESELYAQLESASDLHRLAKALADGVYGSKKMTSNTDIFKRYHTALAKTVLISDGPEKRKFSNTFIDKDDLSPIGEKFRDIFFTYVKRIPFNKNLLEEKIWADLRKKTFATSKNFAASITTGSQESLLQELPNDDVTDKDVSDFLDEFVLAVNQPNEVELGESIKREFGEYSQFNLLNTNFIGDSFQNAILDWFKDKQGVYLVREDARKFFEEMECELSSLITVGINLPYPAKLKKYNIQFECEIRGLQEFLNCSDSTKNVIWQLISPEYTLLTALRIYQTLVGMKEYEKNDSFIFIELKNLLLPEITSQVFRAFQSVVTHGLLVIDCGVDSTRQDTDKLLKTISQTMTGLHEGNITGKKIILIVPEKVDLDCIQLAVETKIIYEAEGEISFDNMKEPTQRKLWEKEAIQFQGREEKVSFVRLLGTGIFDAVNREKFEDHRRIISPKTLVRLITGEELRIGGEWNGLGEIAEYYVPRTIYCSVVIKNRILRDPEITDMFAIDSMNAVAMAKLLATEKRGGEINSPTERSYLTKYIVLKKNREADHFDNLCQRNPNRNIHWLQCTSGKLIWTRSYGSIANLMKHREKNRNHVDDSRDDILRTEEQLAEYDEQRKIVILSDTAGMGKSTVLTRLAETIKKNEPSLLVIKIELTNHTAVLASEKRKRSFNSSDTNGAVDFLVDKLDRTPEREDVQVLVFKTIIKEQRMAALLFDGFDEISPDYKEIVIDLLQALAKLNVKQLFVTTRPHTSRTLEVKLGVFACTLQPFSAEDQIKFLTGFWKKRSVVPDSLHCSSEDEKLLREHARNVVNLLEKSIDPSMKEFTGVPLQTRMVAEVFPPKELQVPEKITIIEMYSKFVDKKYEIHCIEKKGDVLTNLFVKVTNQFEKDGLLKMYQKLALDLLFDKPSIAELLSSSPPGNHSNYSRAEIELLQRYGLVTCKSDYQIRFIHRTFAEYFAARFLEKKLQDNTCDLAMREFFVGELFVKHEYQVIRAFMNSHLGDKNAPLQKESWIFDLRKYRNTSCETAYHVAAKERHVGIAKFLFNNLREDCKDRLSNINVPYLGSGGKTPLIVAVEVLDNLDMVEFLIGAGADVNSTGGSVYKITPLHASIKKAVNFDVLDVLMKNDANINAQTDEGYTPLHLAAEIGRLDLVKYLVENKADVNIKDRLDQTVLHLAARVGDLDLVKFLVEKGSDINSRKIFGELPVHDAVRSGNADLVKYLVDKSEDPIPLTRSGQTLLHVAADSGALDVVIYLVEKCTNIKEYIHSKNREGHTALHAAVLIGRTDLVRCLKQHGANIDAQDNYRSTPLHLAVLEGYVDVVQYLVEEGANINARDNSGSTPLHKAVYCGRENLARYLVKNGADKSAMTNCGETPRQMAITYCNTRFCCHSMNHASCLAYRKYVENFE